MSGMRAAARSGESQRAKWLTIVVFLLNIVYFTFRQGETREADTVPQYTRQRLGEEVESGYVKRLVEHMENAHPYLDPELTIDDLADDGSVLIATSRPSVVSVAR